jgi:translation initiation factor IF-1
VARRSPRGRKRKFERNFEQDDKRDDHIKLSGVVTQVFAGGQFEVTTESGATVRAQLCGRMRKFRIRVILGDRVTVALSPYDLTHGMIVFRDKELSVYEGAFRILRALGDGRSLLLEGLAREAGEGSSVVHDVLRQYPQWFERVDEGIRCTERGLAALAREMVARSAARWSGSGWRADYETIAAERGAPKRELDQVYVTTDTAIRRAELLLAAGEHQRGLAFIGDDDLTSAAVLLRRHAGARHWQHAIVEHDLRQPIPRAMRGRYGAVFTDPPYAIEGFRLFVSRGVDMLKADGRIYICFGQSRRASERGLQKQRVLGEAGLLIEAVLEDFNEYEGAEAIGSRSALWRCRVTPETRPLVRGSVDGPLYTSRSPNA